MLKQFRAKEHIKAAKQLVYENTVFPNGFIKFLDALLTEQVVEDECERQLKGDTYIWVDKVRDGGIKIETTKHPFGGVGSAGMLTITGPKNQLEVVQSILERHRVKYDGSPSPEDIEINVEYHDELNPTLWDRDKEGEYLLHQEVQEALEDVAQAFYDFLDVPNLPIEDVILTGSSANYNYTASSDLDIHIVVDIKSIETRFGKLAVNYFDCKRKIWNELHDIKIKGLPTELYVQDKEELHTSTGIYSIYNQLWVVKPKFEKPSVDDAAVKAKVVDWIGTIRDLMGSNKASVIESFMKKLSKMRQAGLDKSGEFATENVAFKILRNEGYLEELSDLRTKIFDRKLSVEEEEQSIWNHLNGVTPGKRPTNQKQRESLNL
jgi:hypothetical protein